MPVTIRRAVMADLEALCGLFVEFHNFHAAGVPARLVPVGDPDDELRKGVAEILQNERAAVFVACADGQAMGFAEVYVKETEPNPAVVQRRYGLLQSLMVTAACRRQGLGARLVAAAEAWVKEQGATEMDLEIWEFPAGPLRFYESIGYRTTRRSLGRTL